MIEEFDRVIRINVPGKLYMEMLGNDILPAQVYGYMMGRRLGTAPIGSPYRPCALIVDSMLTEAYERVSRKGLRIRRPAGRPRWGISRAGEVRRLHRLVRGAAGPVFPPKRPWYIVPADRKGARNLCVAEIVVAAVLA